MLALAPELNIKDIVVWMGPAIGQTAFEVGEDVLQAFSTQGQTILSKAFTPIDGKSGKYLANLYLLARERLRSLGIEQIDGGDFCTFNDSERFFSYRRDVLLLSFGYLPKHKLGVIASLALGLGLVRITLPA
jgi:copper oxidase (laccase) domain-containing protein